MTPAALTALVDATWPAKSIRDIGGWTVREGAGGGSRVSAATANPDTDLQTFPIAEPAMLDMGQPPLFMVRHGEDLLDTLLENSGYLIRDKVFAYTAPVETLAAQRPPPVTCFEVWPPLATQIEIWAAGGVDDPRIAIMHRAAGPKTTVLGRLNDTPAGTAFAAIHNGIAMIHAVETAQAFRRQGVGRRMMQALGFWAKDNGADTIALLVTQANSAANPLYASLGLKIVGGYHYRIKPQEAP